MLQGGNTAEPSKNLCAASILRRVFKTSKIFTSLTLLLIFFFYNTKIFYCGEIDG
ncbi:hypothetical protein HPMG_00335 [Helicobacter pullorum MIT 98-5489]|uniref:Uncharacterized protein n=1 Tax=Helicobacter pullorum MIT 98-5489 TaxID=537972 RepID=C5EYA8_9HELI|nr:hypothetical protein HPMG_00335 [Helicobacter pullorum MIT 98-5489]